MATAAAREPRAPRPKQLAPRQIAGLIVLHGMVSSAGYELLNHSDGDVAHNLVERSLEIGDLLIDMTSGANA